jgi:serine/threonine protein kinase
MPSVALFDPASITPEGIRVLAELRGRKADLPLVALGGVEPGAAWAARSGLDSRNLHHMGREIPVQAWPATLLSCVGGFGPGAQKFTTEDLFGDILADMEGDPAPAPPPFAVPQPAPQPTPPPVPVPPVPVPPVPVPPAPAPPAPAPPAPVLPVPAPEAAAVPPSKEYTLSGISGVSDPFLLLKEADIRATGPLPPMPEPWPAPAVQAAPAVDDSMEEFGNYYLLEKVAVGGMAELFKARQRGVHDFEKIVAIKRILPHLSDNDEFVRMFIDEAKLAAQLTHPNIVQIFDLGKAMGFYYIAMEYVDGRDLRSLLRKVREYRLPVPEPIAAAVTMKVASALDYAHRKRGINDRELKLVHRDISPQNILISYEGAVKLVDFGIAKAATKSTQTMAGALKGKLLYMSPEQALGQSLDGRSDIYSLGLVLFELLTGERCFQADSELGVLEKVRMGKVLDIRTVNPGVSLEMAALVNKALHRDVEHRYVSARFLERDLKNFLVNNHNEPTEHDVAEYVNTVLKASRNDLEGLLAHRYPPVAPAPTVASPVSPMQGAPARAFAPAPKPDPMPLPPPAPEGMEQQPLWIIPVLILVVAAVAWVAIKLFK